MVAIKRVLCGNLPFNSTCLKTNVTKPRKKDIRYHPRYPISDIRYPISDTTQVFNYEFPVIRVIHFFLLRFYSK